MDPVTMALIGSTVMSAFGQIATGKAQQEASKLNAFNVETDEVRNKIQTLQNSRNRREQYIANSSTNNTMFSAMGRDIGSDRSVEAFFKKQKETTGEDLYNITYMGEAKGAKLKQQATAQRIEGRAAMQSATIGALTTLASGYYEYETIKKANDQKPLNPEV